MEYMKKVVAVGVIILFLGLACAPSINAEVIVISDRLKETNKDDSTSALGYELWFGPLHPSIYIFIVNYGNETFRGNISCIFTVNTSIMIFGGTINIIDYYVEIKPYPVQERELIYQGLMLGFGAIEAILDMPPPVNMYHEYGGFLFFIFLFLKY